MAKSLRVGELLGQSQRENEDGVQKGLAKLSESAKNSTPELSSSPRPTTSGLKIDREIRGLKRGFQRYQPCSKQSSRSPEVEKNVWSVEEVYWNSVLPNSPMPKAVKDLLYPAEWGEDKSTGVIVGHGGVGVQTGKPGRHTNVGVGKGGVNVGTHTKNGKPVYVGVHPGGNPFVYLYAASETQLHHDPNIALFFLQKDLAAGKKMNINFYKTRNGATVLPRKVADSIPFSSHKLPEIFSKFSVDPKSIEAEIMKKTIQECEDETTVKGEEKMCATSLESMIDFSTSKLGKHVEAISTEAEKGGKVKEYSILGVKKMSRGDAVVACHKQAYTYAVFYCHKTETTVAYEVSMVAEDGSKAKAAAVCHLDTAAWNPKHLAFQVLKVRPGSVPVCHFLPSDHVVWVPKN
ncbi:rd22-c protein [Dorcoceras hygrometricum]|uniref:Rd22-c protein n=1 Tax=Dorcoceras hygrometricum TaxID=472368 RepID=A0A2Z7CXQ4_9LAMI|nr:rd22-c protein [Dorcoceras hygrometricum]